MGPSLDRGLISYNISGLYISISHAASMATLLNAIDLEASTTFKLRIAKHTTTCTVKRPASKTTWRSSGIIRGSNDECSLSVNGRDAEQQFSGRSTIPKTSFVLMPTEIDEVLELLPLQIEYDFGESDTLAQINGHMESPSPNADVPDPDNPYDYRHYLQSNGHLSPYPSTTATPLLAPMSRASSPMMLCSDTESLPSMPTGRRPRKTAAVSSRGPTQSQSHKRPIQRTSAPAMKTPLPAPVKSSPDREDMDLVIEDYSQPPPKRQRTAKSTMGPISLAQAARTPREHSQEATLRLDIASSADDEDEENADDHDIEDFRLPDPAAGPPDSSDRKDSIFDPVAVSNLLAAFQEDDDDATGDQAEMNKVESSESESEEE